jgi:hypothetical protein
MSCISPTTAASAPHFSASSIAQITSLSFWRSTKMNRSGSIPKFLKAGGKAVSEVLTQSVVPDGPINAPNIPAMNPFVAAASSDPEAKNS